MQSWDIATTTDERNDWSVCTTWAIKQKDFYLLDVWRARVEFPALRRKIVNHALAHQVQTVLIEKAGPGLQLVQELQNDPTPRFPPGDRQNDNPPQNCAQASNSLAVLHLPLDGDAHAAIPQPPACPVFEAQSPTRRAAREADPQAARRSG